LHKVNDTSLIKCGFCNKALTVNTSIGVLKAFEEEQIKISCLSGTSIGALVAAYYAFGKSADDILKLSEQVVFEKGNLADAVCTSVAVP
jgi:predicted acylesterase/phospholipase RssA